VTASDGEPATDDDVLFAPLRVRIAREPRDERLGLPGVDGDGGGAFRPSPGGLCRVYQKHTAAYDRAAAHGWLAPAPSAPPPASAEAILATEAACGVALPRLLARLYREVANGGFGPAYGLLGVADGHRDDRGRTIWRWDHDGPAALLAICHWGCGIYSLVDASDRGARMWGYDPNPGPADDRALYPQPYGLATWLARWLEGRAHQPWLIEDEAGGWRGATETDYAALDAFVQ
jgi:hypothetical protein